MSPCVLVPLATGCEEIEAVTIIDLLRRAKIEVTVASLEADAVTASRGVRLLADVTLDAVADSSFDLIVLPGGAEGARRLGHDSRLAALLTRQIEQGRRVAAICAAPVVFAQAGLLNNRRATAYPGSLEPLGVPGLVLEDTAAVVMDGPIITSRGPGTAMDFALFLIEQLIDRPTRMRVEEGLQRPVSQRNAPIVIV